MLMLARALILTAGTVAVWLYIVRWQERAEQGERCVVSYVYDGDTVALQCGAREVTARVVGLDAPETRDARCDAERTHGEAATERLRSLVTAGDLHYRRKGNDKYGRWLIRLFAKGEDVAETLVAEGLAMPYRGGARINWCRKLGAT